MTMVPADLKYTDEHEWVRVEPDRTVTVGITDHAQKTLGDLVFLELPKVGLKVEAGQPISVVESVKSATDIFSPVTGEVIAVNTDASDAPEDVNDDPYGVWLFKIKLADKTKVDGLLDAAAYTKLIS
ncbi:glycine cleavage system protein GcvH [Streptomyces sp. NPDC048277]|uniref:glycine cleavage system protein GcvH n=1 Tax=Streptomyces sp. NPDC048277 TaxID=3155027 RepID=UPI0033ECE19E